MNKHMFLPLLLIFLAISKIDYAKAGNHSIIGIVQDENGSGIVGANVVLFRADSMLFVKAELTNDKGEYNIDVKEGTYQLRISFTGYAQYKSEQVSVLGEDVHMPAISLKSNSKALKEVAVTAQKPLIEMKDGKLIVNVENSILSTGNSIMDVLAGSPGVHVDQNDNILLKGRPGVTIMIDGKVQPISATDLANMLKGMPSSMVDKIELISNPSAKYDAAGTAGIINIKMKKDNRVGLNGTISMTHAQGFYAKDIGSLNLNYRNKKINVYANYNTQLRNGFSWVTFNRHYYTDGVYTASYVQDNNSLMKYDVNTASAGLDYNISKKTTIGMSVNADNTYIGVKGYYDAKVLDNTGALQSSFITHNNASGHWNNYGTNFHIQHQVDSTGKQINIDADYAIYTNPNYQDFTTNYYLPDGSQYQHPYLLHGDISGTTQIYSFKADYEQPLKNNGRFEVGIKSSYVTADNEPRFFDRSNNGNKYDSGKSDHFIYKENINAAYINFVKDWTKWSTQIGLRLEQTITDGDEKITRQTFRRDYAQLFPTIAIQRHVNKDVDLGLTLSRRIERPSYEALNPYKFYVDPSTYREGNPYLNPALSYGIELSHIYKQRFVTTFGYSVTKDAITQVILPSPTQDKVMIQTDRNLATLYYYGIAGSYTVPIKKWWTNITNLNIYYTKYVADIANTYLNKGQPAFDVNTNNKFSFKNDWSAEIGLFYQSSQVYGYMDLIPQWSLNAGVQKHIWDKKATIKLNATDIFWHQYPGAALHYTDYLENFIAKHDTRQISLSFTYRFGKKTVAPVKRHQSGAEEEKQRAGGGGAA